MCRLIWCTAWIVGRDLSGYAEEKLINNRLAPRVAIAVLPAITINKEPEGQMHHRSCNQYGGCNTKRGHSRPKPSDPPLRPVSGHLNRTYRNGAHSLSAV